MQRLSIFSRKPRSRVADLATSTVKEPLLSQSGSGSPTEQSPELNQTAGGFSTITRALPGRPDWDSWFTHNGVDPITKDDPGGGGGGGFMHQRGRFMLNIGGSGQGYRRETAEKTASLGSGLGYIDTGYILLRNRFLRIFPLIGAGGLGGTATVVDRSSLDDAHQEKVSIGTAAAEFHVGLGIDMMLPVGTRRRFVLGVRLGYRLFNLEINRDPARSFDPNANGFFWRMIIGFEAAKRS
ncbi:MAG: hypothetical protein KC615_05915 [Anaerolineae bacterium]|nr:hypothetical protein [Anaerolineae bacterium]